MTNDNQNEQYPEIHIENHQFIDTSANSEARLRAVAESGRLIDFEEEDVFLDEIDTMAAIAKEIDRQLDDNETKRMVFEYVHQCLLKAEVFRA